MDFGKLESIENVDFSFPKDALWTQNFFANLSKDDKEKPRVYVGCPSWTCKAWIGKIYPLGIKDKDLLAAYAQNFNTIELNYTHYRSPTKDDVRRWKSLVNEGFKFCPKLMQVVSHHRRLRDVKLILDDFAEVLADLSPHLGTTFLQLPPNFSPYEMERLVIFLKDYPKAIPLTLELRHQDWFRAHHDFDQLCQVMQNEGIGTVITDVAGRRDVLHQRLTAQHVAIRLVGNALHITDYQRIDDWVLCLKRWLEAGMKEIYVFLHQPADVLCPEMAVYFISSLNKICQTSLKVPKIQLLPEQKRLF